MPVLNHAADAAEFRDKLAGLQVPFAAVGDMARGKNVSQENVHFNGQSQRQLPQTRSQACPVPPCGSALHNGICNLLWPW